MPESSPLFALIVTAAGAIEASHALDTLPGLHPPKMGQRLPAWLGLDEHDPTAVRLQVWLTSVAGRDERTWVQRAKDEVCEVVWRRGRAGARRVLLDWSPILRHGQVHRIVALLSDAGTAIAASPGRAHDPAAYDVP